MQFKKLKSGSVKAPKQSQTSKMKNKDQYQEQKDIPPDPKPPDKTNPLGDPSIMSLLRQTCLRLSIKEVLKINDVTESDDARPMVEINSWPIMKDKWLYDTGASITCMSTERFRAIPINKFSQHILCHPRWGW